LDNACARVGTGLLTSKTVRKESQEATPTSPPFRWRIALTVLPLATGIGLVVYLLARFSLRLGIAVALIVGTEAAFATWRKSSPAMRDIIRRRVLAGAVAGLLATLAYDVSRYVVVKAFPLVIWPFDVFPIFGQLLIGPASKKVLYVVGWLYHLVNGTGFAVCFAVLVRRPGILSGLLFAGVLEFLMISLYPSWLGLKAYGEFLSVSVVGHTAYGLVLGLVAKRGITHFVRRDS
jgi:uncharacterized protein DUF6789